MKKAIVIGCAGIILGAGARVFALELATDKPQYWRYEVVTITASLGASETAEGLPAELRATVWKGKHAVVSVGNLKSVPLRKQPDQTWQGRWPIPFNPVLGDYRAEVRHLQPDGTTLTAGAVFTVQGREAKPLPPGFSVVTDEGGRKGPESTPGFTPEEPKACKNMVRWAQFMGADAFWECIGQTQVWAKLQPGNFPWPAGHLRLAKNVGQAAHEAGLQYGAWITAFVVIGQHPEETGYQFTTGYDRKTNTLRPLHYVSLGCQKRIADLAELLKQFEAAPEIDYLGLDYMRTDFGGYEFASEFVRDMSINAPGEWASWPEQERSLWMARLIEVTRDQAARDRWEWWRAHKVAMVVEHLLAEVKPAKPVWIFSLGWQTGHQHGQDVLMMRDAGISFNAPMFYSIPKPGFPNMIQDWETYLQRSSGSLVIGECVDWNLLGRTLNPTGPQEHFDRQLLALQKLRPLCKGFGLFWHDVARSHYGARGPYGTMEWVLAGSASFSQLKAAAGRISYRLDVKTPAALQLYRPAEVRVEVTNATAATLTAVAVEMVDLPRLVILDRGPKLIAELPARQTQSVNFRVRTDQYYVKNGGFQMLAVKAGCSQDAARDPMFAFGYVPVATEAEPAAATGTALAVPMPAR